MMMGKYLGLGVTVMNYFPGLIVFDSEMRKSRYRRLKSQFHGIIYDLSISI